MKEFGSEFHIEYGRDKYFTQIASLKEHHAFVSTGREAILLAARHLVCNNKVVLMPAYCCWSMEAPFIQEGYRIVYYRLNNDLSINIDYLLSLISQEHPNMVMVVNYFGFTTTTNIVNTIKIEYPSIDIIEDFSHCLFSLNDIFNPNVDYYVASIRKSIGIPDGGICISNNDLGEIEANSATKFIQLRLQSEKLKYKYQYTASQSDKDEFYMGLSDAATILKTQKQIIPTQISNESSAILNHTLTEIIKIARTHNYKHLYNLIKDNKNLTIPFNPELNHTSPFTLPILVRNRDEMQKKLAEKGIYAPVLWPITDIARSTCKVASKFSAMMLALPIDQRYDYYDIEEIGKRINETI